VSEGSTTPFKGEAFEPVRAIVHKPRLVKYGAVKMDSRAGRGFSLGELEAVGLDVATARKLGLYVDGRRRSVREENVEQLRRFLAQLGIETSS